MESHSEPAASAAGEPGDPVSAAPCGPAAPAPPDPSRAARLERLVRGSKWFLHVLETARACGAPDCWVGAGALRDLVWDELHGGFRPELVKDVDAAFFDPHDLRPERDQAVEDELSRLLPEVRWDAKNQAAVHSGTSAASVSPCGRCAAPRTASRPGPRRRPRWRCG
jgi:hypothetical protein